MIKKIIITLIAGIIALSFSGCVEGGNVEDDRTETGAIDPIISDIMTDEVDGNVTDEIGDITNGGSVTNDIQVPDNSNGQGNLNGSGNGSGRSDGVLGDRISGMNR